MSRDGAAQSPLYGLYLVVAIPWPQVTTVGEFYLQEHCPDFDIYSHLLLIMWPISAGVCTSLGLGTIQLTTGMTRLGWIAPITEQDTLNMYVSHATLFSELWPFSYASRRCYLYTFDDERYAAIIWIITIASTISLMTGLKVGIKVLSIIGFGLGMCPVAFDCLFT